MSHTDVLVVGAGLAGLCAARAVHAAGLRPLVLEARSAPGGRVRTDLVDGFRLDRGFQILLTAYPEVQRTLDLPALDLRPFRPGALVWHRGRLRRVSDPFRDPLGAVPTLLSGVGTLGDKLRVLGLRRASLHGSLDALLSRPEVTTAEALRRHRFTPGFVDAFWRPLLGGAFFDRELTTSSRMLELVLRMFATGDNAVPSRGMGAIPEQLLAGLPPGCLRTNTRVSRLTDTSVTTEAGAAWSARAVILAVDGPAAAAWAGEPAPRTRATTTVWYAADEAPVDEGVLVLDGEGEGPVNHLAVMSAVAPSYAPSGAALIAANLVGTSNPDDRVLDGAVRHQLGRWFGDTVSRWGRLAVHRIPAALPVVSPGPAVPRRHPSGVWIAGDHVASPSQQGAMASGRVTGEAVAATLRS